MTDERETPEQLPLAVLHARRRALGRESFVVAEANAEALKLIDAWRHWPDGRLALIGPEGAGKTHLAHVWMEASGAELVAAARLNREDAPALVAAGAVAVEDADRMAGDREAEAGLFHLLNLAKAEGAAILITGRGPAKDWPIATPDLASRLRGMSAVALGRPDEALLFQLLAKHFDDRHLRVEPAVVAYIVSRAERSAAAMADAAARLDEAALARGRRITKDFAREVLGL